MQAAALAEERGYEIRNTSESGDEVALAREAAESGADRVVACGGDGTLNGVVRGVQEASRLDDVTLGVVPAGTGNGFADNVGIRGVEHAFEVLDGGEVRRLDLGVVESLGDGPDTPGNSVLSPEGTTGRPFLNSCVCGLTAEASARTESELKKRVGTLAYVLTTLQHTRDFEGLKLDIRAGPEADPVWSGEALVLLVGNARRFPGRQADMEDGKLDLLVVERAPAIDYLASGAVDRFFRGGDSRLTRLTVPSVLVDATEPRQFSLDGEMVEHDRLSIETRERAISFAVGESYEPHPTFE